MTKVIKIKSGSKFEDMASYSRLVAVNDLIFVSNTAGRDPDTKEIPEEIVEQTLQVFTNIERALAAAGSCLADVVAIRVYVQDPADGDAVGAVLGQKFRGIDPACTMTCPPLGSMAYKVEMDVTAYRGASAARVDRIDLAP
ncbi:RidA family protein [Paracoccus sp. MKU1]|uniref:RidA family protein n=1 Tax=Paracoccus sp. MKU1 TaxID=1745182 RepID=UPI0007194239|nr:RidA family protein [Paracoccus sp. MKU1]KRW95216.1 hypothetical protein AQY21_15560 [Paracoccus sp. MKU1]